MRDTGELPRGRRARYTPVTKDSGQREQFDTGAHRDMRRGKGRYDLLSPFMVKRLAQLMERGAEKYDVRNWEQGFPFGRCLDSALRHVFQYLAGERDEDHLAGAVFNIAAVMHFEEMVGRGVMPVGLDDRPDYGAPVNDESLPCAPPAVG